MYSAELSEFVFAAGVKLMERARPDVMYLSTTDYVQHKVAPGVGTGQRVLRDDGRLSRAARCDGRDRSGHGGPRDEREDRRVRPAEYRLPAGCARSCLRCRHDARHSADHGSIRRSSWRARVVRDCLPSSPVTIADATARITAMPGIDLVLSRGEACARFELPADRVGDLVVVSERLTVIGTSVERHDLSGLDAPLRSHGGLSEQQVPLIANRAAGALPAARRWRNFDAFDLALNHLH